MKKTVAKVSTNIVSNIKILPLILIILVTINACDHYFCENGSGEIVTRKLPVTNFSGIDLGVGANVTVSQCSAYVVTVHGNENVVSNLWTSTIGDTWEIRFDDCFKNYILDIEIKMPFLDHLDLSGNGIIKINDFTGQDKLSINVLGAGNIELNEFIMTEPSSISVKISGSGNVDLLEMVNASSLSVNISGSGNLTGHKENPDISTLGVTISGSGNYKGFPLNTDTAAVKLSGSGNTEVFVNNLLEVVISGSGNVFYKGTPVITHDIIGSGELIDSN